MKGLFGISEVKRSHLIRGIVVEEKVSQIEEEMNVSFLFSSSAMNIVSCLKSFDKEEPLFFISERVRTNVLTVIKWISNNLEVTDTEITRALDLFDMTKLQESKHNIGEIDIAMNNIISNRMATNSVIRIINLVLNTTWKSKIKQLAILKFILDHSYLETVFPLNESKSMHNLSLLTMSSEVPIELKIGYSQAVYLLNDKLQELTGQLINRDYDKLKELLVD